MTEYSFLWDGIVTGDATLAPYDKLKFNEYLNAAYNGNHDTALVIPDYLNSLNIRKNSSIAYNVIIEMGAAIVKNFLYVLDSNKTVVVDVPASTGVRFDIIVLQINYSSQKATLVLKKGMEGTSYENAGLPALTQSEGLLFEIPLYYLMVSGSSVISSSIDAIEIEDKRQFVVNQASISTYNDLQLLKNGEFLGTLSNNTPFEWEEGSTPNSTLSYTYLDPYINRGNGVGGAGSIYQDISLEVEANTPLTLSAVVVYNNSITASEPPFYAEFIGILSTGVTLDPIRRYSIVDTNFTTPRQFSNTIYFDQDVVGVRILLSGSRACSCVNLVKGYHPAMQRHIHELVLSNHTPLTDASWNATAKSTGTTAINLNATFTNILARIIRGILCLNTSNDSASAANSTALYQQHSISTNPYNYSICGGNPNDGFETALGIADTYENICVTGNAIPQASFSVFASGAGTLDATVKIPGIIT